MADVSEIPVLGGLVKIVAAPFKLTGETGVTLWSTIKGDGEGAVNGVKGMLNSIWDVPEGAFGTVADVAGAGEALFDELHYDEKEKAKETEAKTSKKVSNPIEKKEAETPAPAKVEEPAVDEVKVAPAKNTKHGYTMNLRPKTIKVTVVPVAPAPVEEKKETPVAPVVPVAPAPVEEKEEKPVVPVVPVAPAPAQSVPVVPITTESTTPTPVVTPENTTNWSKIGKWALGLGGAALALFLLRGRAKGLLGLFKGSRASAVVKNPANDVKLLGWKPSIDALRAQQGEAARLAQLAKKPVAPTPVAVTPAPAPTPVAVTPAPAAVTPAPAPIKQVAAPAVKPDTPIGLTDKYARMTENVPTLVRRMDAKEAAKLADKAHTQKYKARLKEEFAAKAKAQRPVVSQQPAQAPAPAPAAVTPAPAPIKQVAAPAAKPETPISLTDKFAANPDKAPKLIRRLSGAEYTDVENHAVIKIAKEEKRQAAYIAKKQAQATRQKELAKLRREKSAKYWNERYKASRQKVAAEAKAQKEALQAQIKEARTSYIAMVKEYNALTSKTVLTAEEVTRRKELFSLIRKTSKEIEKSGKGLAKMMGKTTIPASYTLPKTEVLKRKDVLAAKRAAKAAKAQKPVVSQQSAQASTQAPATVKPETTQKPVQIAKKPKAVKTEAQKQAEAQRKLAEKEYVAELSKRIAARAKAEKQAFIELKKTYKSYVSEYNALTRKTVLTVEERARRQELVSLIRKTGKQVEADGLRIAKGMGKTTAPKQYTLPKVEILSRKEVLAAKRAARAANTQQAQAAKAQAQQVAKSVEANGFGYDSEIVPMHIGSLM